MLSQERPPLERNGRALLCAKRRQLVAPGKREVQSRVLAVLAGICSCLLLTGSRTKCLWRYGLVNLKLRLVCKAVVAADFSPSKLEAQLNRKWPAWTQNACRRLSQVVSLNWIACMIA